MACYAYICTTYPPVHISAADIVPRTARSIRPSGMAHQILHIPELLSEICSYFSIPTPSYEPPPCADVKQASLYRATLAAIAQSHQTLVYPATRVLWNVLDDVRPLINLYVPLEDDRYPSPDSQDTGSSQELRMVRLLHRSAYSALMQYLR